MTTHSEANPAWNEIASAIHAIEMTRLNGSQDNYLERENA
jgi:hypothetical protein